MRILFMLSAILLATGLKGQNLDSLRWEKRVVAIIDDSRDQAFIDEQLAVLRRDTSGLTERDIVVLLVTPAGYAYGLSKGQSLTALTHPRFRNAGKQFQSRTILFGLDGGIKLESPDIVHTQSLFALIDRMPMRRAEIRRKKGE